MGASVRLLQLSRGMRTSLLAPALALVLVTACAQDDAAQSPTTPRTAADSEPAAKAAAEPAPTPTPPASEPTQPAAAPQTKAPSSGTPTTASPPNKAPTPRPALSITGVNATIVSATVAENERGKQVPPSADGAVAIDLRFELLPGRALDPVLEIGGATFKNYETRPGNVLRFVLAGPELAEAGAVVLRWGDDVVPVANQLRVAR